MKSILFALLLMITAGPAMANLDSGSPASSTGTTASTTARTNTSSSLNVNEAAYQSSDRGSVSGRRWYNPFSWFRRGNNDVAASRASAY